MPSSYYEKHKEVLKKNSREKYKKEKWLIMNGVKKNEDCPMYQYWLENKDRSEFKIRHGKFHIKEELKPYFDMSYNECIEYFKNKVE